MSFTVDISAVEDQADRFAAMPDKANAALRDQMQTAMQAVASDIQANKLSGQVLNVRSGRLRDSITAFVSSTGNLISGSVGSNVPYAAILEYGGTILRSKIRTYRINEPERSYLRTALAEQADAVEVSLTQALMEAIT